MERACHPDSCGISSPLGYPKSAWSGRESPVHVDHLKTPEQAQAYTRRLMRGIPLCFFRDLDGSRIKNSLNLLATDKSIANFSSQALIQRIKRCFRAARAASTPIEDTSGIRRNTLGRGLVIGEFTKKTTRLSGSGEQSPSANSWSLTLSE